MNLIQTVAELQNQIAEAKRKKIPRFTIPIIESLDEHGEDMLRCLAYIQPGDAIYLDMILGWLGGSVFTKEFSEEEYEALTILFDMVKRLQAMCQLMEAEP
jgi:hypothetical protein